SVPMNCLKSGILALRVCNSSSESDVTTANTLRRCSSIASTNCLRLMRLRSSFTYGLPGSISIRGRFLGANAFIVAVGAQPGLEERLRWHLARRPLPGRARAPEMSPHPLKLAGEVLPRRIGLRLELIGDFACHRTPPGAG